jgi:hypothetical protein
MKVFFDVRNLPGLKKETVNQRTARLAQAAHGARHPASVLHTEGDKVSVPPLVGALLKNEQDVTLFEKLVFMQSRNR